MSRLALAAVPLAALVTVTACGGGGVPRAAPPSASPRASASVSPSARPSAKPTPKPTPSRSPSRSPSPSPSPTAKPTGTPVTAAGTALGFVRPTGTTVPANADCATVYPELFDVSCDTERLDAGSVLWIAGTDAGRWTLRLLTFSDAGYVLRFQADDPDGSWTGFRLGTTGLTGHGTDALVVATLQSGADARRSYDVLTWRKGGPLVLRAHRGPLKQGRVVLAKGSVEEYEAQYVSGEAPCCPGRFLFRRLAWDGTRFVLATVASVGAARVPSADG